MGERLLVSRNPDSNRDAKGEHAKGKIINYFSTLRA